MKTNRAHYFSKGELNLVIDFLKQDYIVLSPNGMQRNTIRLLVSVLQWGI